MRRIKAIISACYAEIRCTSGGRRADLTWDSGRLAALLGQVSRDQGRLLGRMQELGFDLRREAQLAT